MNSIYYCNVMKEQSRMPLDPKENHKDTKKEIQKERRSFLKKTVYTVPSIVALGHLVRPTVASAVDSGFDDRDGPFNGGGFGGNGAGPGGL